jgi:hypothetical protein
MDLSAPGSTFCAWWYKVAGGLMYFNLALLLFAAYRLSSRLRKRRNSLPWAPPSTRVKWVFLGIAPLSAAGIAGLAIYVVESAAKVDGRAAVSMAELIANNKSLAYAALSASLGLGFSVIALAFFAIEQTIKPKGT